MAMETASLVIKVDSSGAARATASLDKLGKEAQQAERAADRLSGRWKAAGTVIGAVIGTAGVVAVATAALHKFITNTIEAEKAQAQLAAVLKSTGQATGLNIEQLNGMADALQKVTAFDDEAINGAQSLLLTFTKIGRDVFPRATETVLDMSVALGQDLKSSAVQLGKALQDPILGITALRRVGVNFSDAQKDVIQALVETGQTAAAQKLILAELQVEFGGSARAARNTLGGALASLKISFDNLFEGDTATPGMRDFRTAVEKLNDTLNDPETKEGFNTSIAGLVGVANAAITATAKIGALISRYNDWLASKGLVPTDESSTPEALQARRNRLQGMVDVFESGRDPIGNALLAKQLRQQISAIDLQQGAVPDYLKADILSGKKPFSAVGFSVIDPRRASAGEAEATVSGTTAIRARTKATQEASAADKAWAEQMADFAALDDMREQATRDVAFAQIESTQAQQDATERGRTATAGMLSDMQFEIDLTRMSVVEREKAIALRYANVDALSAEGVAVAGMAEKLARAREAEQVLHDVQGAATQFAVSAMSDLDNVGDAFENFADRLKNIAIQMLAEKAIQALFGLFTGTGGFTAAAAGSAGEQSAFDGWFSNAGKATGGLITGPGSGTSDSIPARLSNGEYVIQADSVKRYGSGLFDSLNAKRFASGGQVGAGSPGMGAMPSIEVRIMNNGRPVEQEGNSEITIEAGKMIVKLAVGEVARQAGRRGTPVNNAMRAGLASGGALG